MDMERVEEEVANVIRIHCISSQRINNIIHRPVSLMITKFKINSQIKIVDNVYPLKIIGTEHLL